MRKSLAMMLPLVGFVGPACDATAQSVSATREVSYLAPANVPALPASPRRYEAPTGFSGHSWGEPHSKFEKLPREPEVVLATWTRGKPQAFQEVCSGSCTVEEFLRRAIPMVHEGDGFHVLSEYLPESQGFKFPHTGVVLHPVVYQFCANWHGVRRKPPEKFDELNKFCGMRMLFETETRAQLRALPEDHVTRYDLVLAELISRYGKPANFTWRGRVTVEPIDGGPANSPRSDRKFSSWRWCPAPRDGLMTRCESSIVLSIDPDIGRGIVLISTPAVWQYAWARENSDVEPDPLYTLLHALSLKDRAAYAKRQADRRKKEAGIEHASSKAGESVAPSASPKL